ncbi:MAG: HD-GYP domain-containing protein [Peptococcaceae bacterium]|nr:HD-GYP domain-containing protein [Peptococcaceae bacterium]
MLDLVPIRPDSFQIGMHVEGNVYYLAGTQYTLIFGDRIVDKDIRDNLFRVAAKAGHLYVPRNQFEKITRQGIAFNQIRTQIEKTVGYQALLNNATRIFDKMKNNNKLDLIIIDVLVQQLQEKIDTVPTHALLQSINLLESDVSYLYRHSINVALINGLLAKWLNLAEKESHDLIYGGLLHDIGKLNISESILSKPEKLTEQEYELIKKHPLFSYEILRDADVDNETVLHCALYHHERIRGDGYPKQLKLEDTPLSARITSISDSYDAMVSNRYHQNALSPFEILQEFSQDKYSLFDISIMNVLLDEFSRNLIGRDVLLSDGSIATVKFIRENNYAHPMVEYNGELVQTNEHLKPLCMCG